MWLLVVIVILLDGYVPSGSLDVLKVANTITAIISTLVLGSQGWMRLDMCPVVLVVTCGWTALLPQTSLHFLPLYTHPLPPTPGYWHEAEYHIHGNGRKNSRENESWILHIPPALIYLYVHP